MAKKRNRRKDIRCVCGPGSVKVTRTATGPHYDTKDCACVIGKGSAQPIRKLKLIQRSRY